MRGKEIHGDQQCLSEPQWERAKQIKEGGEEDRTIIMKGLYFVESLPCLWLNLESDQLMVERVI